MTKKNFNLFIILSGLASTFIFLLVVYFISLAGFNLMGYYAVFIFPVGALIVGVGSGSGYALGSWIFNTRIRKKYIFIIAWIALGAYAASHYVTYMATLQAAGRTMEEISFLTYIQFITENTTYTLGRSGEAGIELGKFAYIFLVLEAAGFILGSIIPSGILSLSAYCISCKLYMKKHSFAVLSSSLTTDDLKKKKSKEKEALLLEAIKDVSEKYREVAEKLVKLPLDESLNLLNGLPGAKEKKVLSYANIKLFKCPDCDNHKITSQLFNLRMDMKWTSTKMDNWNKQKDTRGTEVSN